MSSLPLSATSDSKPQDRRVEPRHASHVRGIVVGPAFELGCIIVDSSGGGLRLRLDRQLTLPSPIIVVDIAAGTACEGEAAWTRGVDAGMKCRSATSLRGLVPSRLAGARAAWVRAGGR
ncbi:hypothetical protein BH10PSE2_BH10PSE2_24720 [soil metagenome]